MNTKYWEKAYALLRIKVVVPFETKWLARYQRKYSVDHSFSEAVSCYQGRNAMHEYAHHYFSWICPQKIKDHRSYFKQNSRGFGEDAFHSMWWMLLREYHPRHCLEIGVYRGQVISLWALIARELGFPCETHGISPFSPIGDSVSVYLRDVDYMVDTLDSFRHFSLPLPVLIKALSADTVSVSHIKSRAWDLIYIDGSHEFETVLDDYRVCYSNLRSGGLLVLDDSSLDTDFNPPAFSFAGHPGPSRVIKEYVMKEMRFLGAVGHNNVFQKK